MTVSTVIMIFISLSLLCVFGYAGTFLNNFFYQKNKSFYIPENTASSNLQVTPIILNQYRQYIVFPLNLSPISTLWNNFPSPLCLLNKRYSPLLWITFANTLRKSPLYLQCFLLASFTFSLRTLVLLEQEKFCAYFKQNFIIYNLYMCDYVQVSASDCGNQSHWIH